MQPTSTTCGQAYIAMITGKSIEEVIQTMKTDTQSKEKGFNTVLISFAILTK